MSEHAPTPWRTNEPNHSNYALEIVATNARGNEELVCRPPGKRREANAALIVKAVNNHAKLVEALDIARKMIAGEIIEAAVIDTQTMEGLGSMIDRVLADLIARGD